MKNKWLILFVVCAVVLSVASMAISMIQPLQKVQATMESQTETTRTLHTNGQAVIHAEPNMAYIMVGVRTFHEDSTQAQTDNSIVMNRVFDALHEYGIHKGDIATAYYHVYLKYEWKHTDSQYESEWLQVGFDVDNTVRITIYNVDSISHILTLVVEQGINKVSSVQFEISEDKKDEYRLQALQAALANAKLKAETMAAVYNIRLDIPIQVYESTDCCFSPYYYESAVDVFVEINSDLTKQMPPIPISSGKMDIRASVNLTYSY